MMAKFKVDYGRQMKELAHAVGVLNRWVGYSIDDLKILADDFAIKNHVSADMIRLHFEPDDESQIILHLKAARYETDAEYAKRIKKEEARVATDKENARKSKAKQEEVDRRVLESMKERYGVEWIEKGIGTFDEGHEPERY